MLGSLLNIFIATATKNQLPTSVLNRGVIFGGSGSLVLRLNLLTGILPNVANTPNMLLWLQSILPMMLKHSPIPVKWCLINMKWKICDVHANLRASPVMSQVMLMSDRNLLIIYALFPVAMIGFPFGICRKMILLMVYVSPTAILLSSILVKASHRKLTSPLLPSLTVYIALTVANRIWWLNGMAKPILTVLLGGLPRLPNSIITPCW